MRAAGHRGTRARRIVDMSGYSLSLSCIEARMRIGDHYSVTVTYSWANTCHGGCELTSYQ